MYTAATIIATPPVISKYFNAPIVVLLGASALLPVRHLLRLRNRLSSKKNPEDLPEDEFFRQQRHRYRKNQSRYHCHECNNHLHSSPKTFPAISQIQGGTQMAGCNSLKGMGLLRFQRTPIVLVRRHCGRNDTGRYLNER